MLAVLGAILAIGLLIVVHEAGHYFVARRCKMRVDRFSIGFGPPILKWRRGETDFTLGPIPFGGFVQIHGMTLAEEVAPDDDRAYPNRPAWQRFATIFAGPGTNYLTAIVLALILFGVAGVHSGTSWYLVDKVDPAFDAQGKLEAGDRILRIDGKPIYFTYEGEVQPSLAELVNASGGKALDVTVLRDGREVDVQILPKLGKNEKEEDVYRLGIELAYEEERVGVGAGQVIGHALYYPVEKTKLIATGLYEIVTGQQKATFMGPVGITDMIKRTFEIGWIRAFELLMLLNVYLGLFNLLPLPALDGGRLVFLGYEMATRRRANPKVEATVHMVGIMALLLLMVLVTYQDIARLFS
ncbi:MAG TPA: M50 family metallopeptidase [Kofleriaceae bacterium]|nr:M50 family metallopeptidase [Kofleriaceae bacterium]